MASLLQCCWGQQEYEFLFYQQPGYRFSFIPSQEDQAGTTVVPPPNPQKQVVAVMIIFTS